MASTIVRSGRWRGRGRGRGSSRPQESQLRPTHFLALPIGHHPALRHSMAAFQTALLQHSPPIPGIDNSIVIDPRRMHLTLGVMTLGEVNTLDSALALLDSLKPRITAVLAGQKLRIDLNALDIMRPDQGDLDKAHVLWMGPTITNNGDDDTTRLRTVCNIIHQSFKDSEFVLETRPLKLHCTVLNTTHRKPRRPFSYSAVLDSSALGAIAASPQAHVPLPATQRNIRMGTWDIDEVQICKMGSHGPENEYPK